MADKAGMFQLGQRYENRRGPYEVIEINPPQVRIRYDSGEINTVDLETQARIIENMSRAAPPVRAYGQKAGPPGGAGQPGMPPPLTNKTRRPRQHPHASQRHQSSNLEAEFLPGTSYRRRDLHEVYDGQRQGGICTPRNFSIILLFSGKSGESFGYADYWDDNDVFHYYGEGQYGDMEFLRGNRAIRDHLKDGKELHLFETLGGGDVKYLGRMTCIGYDEVTGVLDAAGKRRTAIVFRLLPD